MNLVHITCAITNFLKTCFMRTISYAFQSGDAVQKADFAFPPTSNKDFPSCGVFAFAKSGSVLVNAIVRDLMAAASVPVIDWPAVWYWQGVDTGSFQADLSEVFPARGYCFAGFREIPRSFLGAPAIRRLRKIIVVRDPRDMLVSRYFSTKYSHGFEPRGTAQVAQLMRQLIDDGQTDLDSYCLHYSWIVNADFFMHRDIILDPRTKVFRYEDFLYDKHNLIDGICSWFDLPLSQEQLNAIVTAQESIPDVERPNYHVRQAHPGDYRRKLRSNTIQALNSVLKDYLEAFGYETECA